MYWRGQARANPPGNCGLSYLFANDRQEQFGDELMAFFGAPVSTGDDTLNALQTAWEMQQLGVPHRVVTDSMVGAELLM